MVRYRCLLMSVVLASAVACAQEPEPASLPPVAATAEPGASAAQAPGVAPAATQRVARLTFVAGDVQVQRTDNTEEGRDAPVINMPLTEGTRLVTGDYGQAEVEFEDGSVVRLTPRSAIGLDALALTGQADNQIAHTQVTLLNGLAYFELRKAVGWEYRVDAGGAQVTPLANAILRVGSVDAPATFALLSGEARVERPNGFRVNLKAGESLRLDDKDEGRYYLQSSVAEETWDQWNESRDRVAGDEVDKQTGAREGYAGAQGYGWSEMDASGSWYQVAGAGLVWQPDVADEGFDPYGFGNWVWSNVGYTWASGYGWGWTPFRCGRWTFLKGLGWGWIPDGGCGRWGFGGGGTVPVTHGPPGYRQVKLPLRGPGKVHPIVPVLGPNGPRPRVLPGGPVKVGSGVVLPLPPLGPGYGHGGPALGQALNRDFPINARTGGPVFGVETSDPGILHPGTVGSTIKPPSTPRDGVGRESGRRQRGGEPLSPIQAPGARPPANVAVRPAPQPVRTSPSVSAPVHGAAPAPVHPAPAPVQPAPVPTPVHSDPAMVRPKG